MDPSSLNPQDLFSAKGLVAVITGGGTGLGLAFTTALLKTGARKIYILGRRGQVLQDAASSLDSSGKVIVAVQCDVADVESIKAAAARVRKDAGYVDVLINNAGVAGPNHTKIHSAKSLQEIQETLLSQADAWQTALAINTTSVTLVTAAFLDLLDNANKRRGYASGKKDRGEGGRARNVDELTEDVDKHDERTSQVITVSSVAAFNRFMTLGMAYNASKAGALASSKTLSTFLAPWGIRSNVIAPGIFPSEMTEGMKRNFPFEEVPAHRQGNLSEIAGTLLYMVGKSGAYLNGIVQVVDGGRLAVHPATY